MDHGGAERRGVVHPDGLWFPGGRCRGTVFRRRLQRDPEPSGKFRPCRIAAVKHRCTVYENVGKILRAVPLQKHRHPVVQREFHWIRYQIPALNRDPLPLQPFGVRREPDQFRDRSGIARPRVVSGCRIEYRKTLHEVLRKSLNSGEIKAKPFRIQRPAGTPGFPSRHWLLA